jgi:hypothetical protein
VNYHKNSTTLESLIERRRVTLLAEKFSPVGGFDSCIHMNRKKKKEKEEA